MLGLTVEVSAFADSTHLGRSGVEILRLSDNVAVRIPTILLHFNSICHVLIRCLVGLFSNDFSWLEWNIMTCFLVSLGIRSPHNFLERNLKWIVYGNVRRLRDQRGVKMALLDLLGSEITGTDNNVTFCISSGYRIC